MGFPPLYGGWHGWDICSKSDMKTTWMTETTVERKDCSEQNGQTKLPWQTQAVHTCICKDQFHGQFQNTQYVERVFFIPYQN